VKDKYRGKGLESAMLIEGLKVGINAGVRESEASWILEDNVMMCRVLEAIGGRVYKNLPHLRATALAAMARSCGVGRASPLRAAARA